MTEDDCAAGDGWREMWVVCSVLRSLYSRAMLIW